MGPSWTSRRAPHLTEWGASPPRGPAVLGNLEANVAPQPLVRRQRRSRWAFAQRWGRRVRNYIALDSKVLGLELAAHTRRSFNSTDREAIVRQQRRRRFIPAFSFPGLDSIPGVIRAKDQPKFPIALRGLLAKPLLKQDR